MKKVLSVLLAVMLLVQAACVCVAGVSAEAPVSILPANASDFTLIEGNGGVVEVTAAESGYQFSSESGWPSAYYWDESSWLTLGVDDEAYLNFNFEVVSGETNVIVYFAGQNPADLAAKGSFVCLNGFIDPSCIDPETGDAVADLPVGKYSGSVKVGNLGCSESLIADGNMIISGCKVFAVGGTTVVSELSVGAAQYDILGEAETPSIELSMSSIDAEVGDTVTVDVSVSENHYMVNGQIFIHYDPEALEIQTVWDDEDNPYFEDYNAQIFKSSYMWAFAVPTPGEARFAFASSSSKGTTAGGVMFSLTFKVLEGAAGGTDITFNIPEMCSNDGTTNSGEDYEAELVLVDGRVNVQGVAVVKGDVTGDGVVALADAMQAFYHVNEKIVLEGDAFAAADLDGNGEISIGEAMKIFYFVNEKIEEL